MNSSADENSFIGRSTQLRRSSFILKAEDSIFVALSPILIIKMRFCAVSVTSSAYGEIMSPNKVLLRLIVYLRDQALAICTRGKPTVQCLLCDGDVSKWCKHATSANRVFRMLQWCDMTTACRLQIRSDAVRSKWLREH